MRDFREMFGFDLALYDSGGKAVVLGSPVWGSQKFPGREMFYKKESGVSLLESIEMGGGQPKMFFLGVGLVEVVVPLRLSGSMIGFFLFIGRSEERESGDGQHEFSKAWVEDGSELGVQEFESLKRQLPTMTMGKIQAITRMVEMACRQFSLLASKQFMVAEIPLPAISHQARRFIRDNALSEPCLLSHVARECGVSEPHLSRVFHRSTGLTFGEYITRFRVEHAKEMLKKKKDTITQIAFASGFQSISQFNRSFKKNVGMTPTAYQASGVE